MTAGIFEWGDEDELRTNSGVGSPNELYYHHIDHATGYVNWLSGGRWATHSTPGIFISEDIVSAYSDYNVGSQAVLSSTDWYKKSNIYFISWSILAKY